MPDHVVKKTFDNQLIYGLKVDFLGITKSKLYKLLQPTENIFNTGTEITSFSPKDFEINEQLEVENFIKKNTAIFCMIISSNNPLEFFLEENKTKDSLDLQLTKVDGTFPEIIDKKIHEFSIVQIGKKKKWSRLTR